ncbi:DUF427 domain-containing protein [Wenzhouxiangella sp. XN24]|uniref:DUF427 domain-containing protein n=1 Tax=Wenzhouxiangella sp. XN24 TaxID=2713569 RepID=UPI0013ED3E3D|nr:DUF427 domain-containing protein [Wenzhouxiangella sp. XN24]NGX16042.1 DUF427 domain-containing protein [Wenzhouxiangella sp. XN24]
MTTLPAEESAWEYPRPPRIERIDWPLKVEDGGMILAATTDGLRVLETSHPPCYYFPPGDVDFSRLEPSATRTFCEWKGWARYWHLRTEAGLVEDVCWAYPEPTDERIRDHVSFYAGRVEACYVAGERVQPQDGDFYGGWITSWVKGPFKGGPGTRGW